MKVFIQSVLVNRNPPDLKLMQYQVGLHRAQRPFLTYTARNPIIPILEDYLDEAPAKVLILRQTGSVGFETNHHTLLEEFETLRTQRQASGRPIQLTHQDILFEDSAERASYDLLLRSILHAVSPGDELYLDFTFGGVLLKRTLDKAALFLTRVYDCAVMVEAYCESAFVSESLRDDSSEHADVRKGVLMDIRYFSLYDRFIQSLSAMGLPPGKALETFCHMLQE